MVPWITPVRVPAPVTTRSRIVVFWLGAAGAPSGSRASTTTVNGRAATAPTSPVPWSATEITASDPLTDPADAPGDIATRREAQTNARTDRIERLRRRDPDRDMVDLGSGRR